MNRRELTKLIIGTYLVVVFILGFFWWSDQVVAQPFKDWLFRIDLYDDYYYTPTPPPTLTPTPEPGNAKITVAPIKLPDASPVTVKDDKILKISVTFNNRPAFASITRKDNGVITSLGLTDSNGILYATYAPNNSPSNGAFSSEFGATFFDINVPSVTTVYSYSSSGSVTFTRVLDQGDSFWLNMNMLLRNSINIDPSQFIPNEFWGSVVGFLQLAFEYFINYQAQAGDLVTVETYRFRPAVNDLPDIYQIIGKIERQGKILVQQTIFDYKPEASLQLANAGFIEVAGQLSSPATLSIIDAQGRRTGVNPVTGQVVNEIPGSYYTGFGTEPQAIIVLAPSLGQYTIAAVGTNSGTIHLDTGGFMPTGKTQRQSVVLPISPGETISQSVLYGNNVYLPLVTKAFP